MRESNKEFELYEQVLMKKIARQERITKLTEDKVNGKITVNIQYLDAEGNTINGENVVISGDDYESLKPAIQEYESKLWGMVDQIHSRA